MRTREVNSGDPYLLGCLGVLTEFVQGTTMSKQISLFSLWNDTLTRQQSNLKSLMTKTY